MGRKITIAAIAATCWSVIYAADIVSYSVSADLPANWLSGERVEVNSDGYAVVNNQNLIFPTEPIAAPALPVWATTLAVPTNATDVTLSVDVEWDSGTVLPATLCPLPEPVPFPQSVVYPEPDSSCYGSSPYPASPGVLGERIYIDREWRRRVTVTPYRYTHSTRTLERATSLKVTITYKAPVKRRVMSMMSTTSTTSVTNFVILSPSAFKDLWQGYIDYRKITHPHINISVKNTAEIYAAYGDAVAAGDYALAIHKYLENEYTTNTLKIALLGGAVPVSVT